MQARALLLTVFLAYVALDLGCPLVPGAFSFDPAASVDGVTVYRTRPPALPGPASLPAALSVPPPTHVVESASEAHVVSVPVGWRPHAVRPQVATPDSRRATDDD